MPYILNNEKVDELHVTVATHDVCMYLYVFVKHGLIVCICETWFKDYNMDSCSLTMQGLCLQRKDRNHRRAGGVLFLTSCLNDMASHDLEVMWIKVMPKECL